MLAFLWLCLFFRCRGEPFSAGRKNFYMVVKHSPVVKHIYSPNTHLYVKSCKYIHTNAVPAARLLCGESPERLNPSPKKQLRQLIAELLPLWTDNMFITQLPSLRQGVIKGRSSDIQGILTCSLCIIRIVSAVVHGSSTITPKFTSMHFVHSSCLHVLM